MTQNLPTSTEFCSKCGSLVSLPTHGDFIECFRCQSKIPLSGRFKLTKEYEFNPITTKKVYQDKKDWLEDYQNHNRILKEGEKFNEEIKDVDDEYAKIDQQCIKEDCDSNTCVYFTQQTRGADEGQTIFYRCVKCK
jgi:DNA-directed RNA polymerase I subunit RPA12